MNMNVALLLGVVRKYDTLCVAMIGIGSMGYYAYGVTTFNKFQ